MDTRPDTRSAGLPIATAAVFVVTAFCTAVTLAQPALVPLLRRAPGMLADGELWRLVTPIFINPEGWLQIALNGAGLLAVGTAVERRFGPLRWLAIYFGSGLVGEVAGAFWQPDSAGSSVGVVGLIGAYAAMMLETATPRARLIAAALLLGALAVTALRDIHGPPCLVGFALGWAMLRRARPAA